MAKPPKRIARQWLKAASRPTPTPTPSSIIRAELRAHSGPLPAPEDLARYDELLPGAAERILSMAEREQHHRTHLERLKLEADIRHREDTLQAQKSEASALWSSNLIGQLLGGLVALTCAAGAIYALWIGAPWYIIAIFLGLPVAAIVKAVRSRGTHDKAS